MLDYVVTFIYSDGNNSSYLFETEDEARAEMKKVLKDMEIETKEDTPFKIKTEILYNKNNMEGALLIEKKPTIQAVISRIYE